MKYSLFLPSRDRIEGLERLLESIYSNFCGIYSMPIFEIIIRLDSDDSKSINAISSLSLKYDGPPCQIKFIVGTRCKGWCMQYYVNELCKLASGKYIFGLNDDVTFLTKNWEIELEKSIKEDKIYYPIVNGYKESFFIMPRKFFIALNEHICPHNHIDTYISKIGEKLGINEYLTNFELNHWGKHDNFKDQTYQDKMLYFDENAKKREEAYESERFYSDVEKIKAIL